jgi:syntaxin 5
MQSVESTIAELSEVFKQLAVLVHEQGEQIVRIDANVAATELNVEAAHSELVKVMYLFATY